jgi:hypothetical protein
MPDLEAIVDEAHLLKPGDIVAVTFRAPLSPETEERVRTLLAKTENELGVRFILFEDADFDVFRPVEDE